MRKLIAIFLILSMIACSAIPVMAVADQFSIEALFDKSAYNLGEEVRLTGKIINNGAGYSNTDVMISIVKEDQTVVFSKQILTDNNGNFEALYTLPIDAQNGRYIANISSVGKSKTIEFQVNKKTTVSSVSVDKSSYEVGETVNISGIVYKDDKAQSFVDVIVKVYFGDNIKFTKQLRTDSNGEFKTTYSLSENQTLGVYQVHANAIGEVLCTEFSVIKKDTPIPTLQSIQISSPATEIEVGKTLKLSVEGTMSDGSAAPTEALSTIEWSSSNNEIATVSVSGLVSAHKSGDVTITAKVLDITDDIALTIKAVSPGGPGGGGSPGGGGGTGGTTSEQKIEKKTESGTATIITDSKGNKSISFLVDPSKMESLLNTVQGEVTINAALDSKATKIDISMDTNILKKLTDKKKVLNVNLGYASFALQPGTFDIKEGTNLSLSGKKLSDSESKEVLANKDQKICSEVSSVYDFDITYIKGSIKEKAVFNKPITVKLGYDSTKVKNSLKLGVYCHNDVSKKWEYVGGKKAQGGTITYTANHFSRYLVMEFNKIFSDVQMAWAKNEVEVLAAKNIINSNGDIYSPKRNITRAEFAKILVCALSLEKDKQTVSFKDVKDGAWYKSYVDIASSHGIIKGSNGEFNPNGEITREAMATMVVRAMKLVNPKDDYSKSDITFNDKTKVSTWAFDEVGIVTNKGLINGIGNNSFAPQNNMSRAEAAVVVYRLLGKLGEL